MLEYTVDPSRDLSRKRELILNNGTKYIVEQPDGDPYGFWYIRMDHGQVPDVLSGAYTSFEKARRAVEEYLNKTSALKRVAEVKMQELGMSEIAPKEEKEKPRR